MSLYEPPLKGCGEISRISITLGFADACREFQRFANQDVEAQLSPISPIRVQMSKHVPAMTLSFILSVLHVTFRPLANREVVVSERKRFNWAAYAAMG